MMYRITKTNMRIIDTSGQETVRPVLLYFDEELGEFGCKFVGDSPAKGYCFQLSQSELKRVRDQGMPTRELPKHV